MEDIPIENISPELIIDGGGRPPQPECPFQPLGSYIMVRMHNVEEKTLQGIYIPNTKDTGVCKAIVVKTNKGRWVLDGTKQVPSAVQPGEIVYFFKQNAFEIPHTGFYLVPEEILLCKGA